jgi:mannose-6-phosphate isomerase-like protein (cupin superfamily)
LTRGEDLAARLRSEGLDPSGWGNGPGDVYSPHSHGYDKVLVATQGSITFHLIDLGRDVTLGEGERLELPAGTKHGATVGSNGVQCLEAHLPAGSLQAEPRHRTEGW